MIYERTVPVLKNVSIDLDVVARFASLGLNREAVAGYWGMNATQFEELCSLYPEINEAFSTGVNDGISYALKALESTINETKITPIHLYDPCAVIF